jgi:hypothetical protein
MPFAVELSPEISHRYDFPILCNARGYVDAVEVGVDMGVFARDFLARWKGYWLILVDPFAPYPEIPVDRTLDMMAAVQALAPFHGRFRFIRQRSPEAIPLVLKFIKPPGFVYVDGEHDEASVRADLEAWWDVLPETGLIAGHDFDDSHPGVTGSVTKFAKERGLVVRLTHEQPPEPPSWMIYKTEPPTLKVSLFRRGEEANPHAARRD